MTRISGITGSLSITKLGNTENVYAVSKQPQKQ